MLYKVLTSPIFFGCHAELREAFNFELFFKYMLKADAYSPIVTLSGRPVSTPTTPSACSAGAVNMIHVPSESCLRLTDHWLEMVAVLPVSGFTHCWVGAPEDPTDFFFASSYMLDKAADIASSTAAFFVRLLYSLLLFQYTTKEQK